MDQDLKAIMQNLENVVNPLRACYGAMDMTGIRAEEASGAGQRLVWAVERQLAKRRHAGG